MEEQGDANPPQGLTAYVRPLVALTLTGIVGWLAVMGNKEAMIAVISAFGLLLGALWGERAALKIPGKDQ